MEVGRWELKQTFCFLHHLIPKEKLQIYRNILSLLEYLGQNHDLDCREQETKTGALDQMAIYHPPYLSDRGKRSL